MSNIPVSVVLSENKVSDKPETEVLDDEETDPIDALKSNVKELEELYVVIKDNSNDHETRLSAVFELYSFLVIMSEDISTFRKDIRKAFKIKDSDVKKYMETRDEK